VLREAASAATARCEDCNGGHPSFGLPGSGARVPGYSGVARWCKSCSERHPDAAPVQVFLWSEDFLCLRAYLFLFKWRVV
jgi:hypothetical protein